MEVFFATSELAGLLGSEQRRVREFGAQAAKRIDLRLQQLRGAPTLEHVRNLPGRCHELNTNLRGHLAIDVQPPLQLIFRPFDRRRVKPDAGPLNWAIIEGIIITDITNYQ